MIRPSSLEASGELRLALPLFPPPVPLPVAPSRSRLLAPLACASPRARAVAAPAVGASVETSLEPRLPSLGVGRERELSSSARQGQARSRAWSSRAVGRAAGSCCGGWAGRAGGWVGDAGPGRGVVQAAPGAAERSRQPLCQQI